MKLNRPTSFATTVFSTSTPVQPISRGSSLTKTRSSPSYVLQLNSKKEIMYKILVVIRTTQARYTGSMVSLTSQLIEFDTKQEIDYAIEAIKTEYAGIQGLTATITRLYLY